jgi:thiol:disulfide interchange protein
MRILRGLVIVALLLPFLFLGGRKVYRRIESQKAWQEQLKIPLFENPQEWTKRVEQLQGKEPFNEQIVLLSADWCGSCKALESSLDFEKIPFVRADIDTTKVGEEIESLLVKRNVFGVPQVLQGNHLIDPDIHAIKARKGR